mmetsp:Transcript_12944/g.43236  ORF Transcript_12944/g.43236 Transcript_12944/m.43236 type:complete len:269 (-) Transcript_12944:324-1130(-)
MRRRAPLSAAVCALLDVAVHGAEEVDVGHAELGLVLDEALQEQRVVCVVHHDSERRRYRPPEAQARDEARQAAVRRVRAAAVGDERAIDVVAARHVGADVDDDGVPRVQHEDRRRVAQRLGRRRHELGQRVAGGEHRRVEARVCDARKLARGHGRVRGLSQRDVSDGVFVVCVHLGAAGAEQGPLQSAEGVEREELDGVGKDELGQRRLVGARVAIMLQNRHQPVHELLAHLVVVPIRRAGLAHHGGDDNIQISESVDRRRLGHGLDT